MKLVRSDSPVCLKSEMTNATVLFGHPVIGIDASRMLYIAVTAELKSADEPAAISVFSIVMSSI
jgi:hypothetical protein